MFGVSVKPWQHSDIHIWVPTFWTLRTLGVSVWGQSGILLKEQCCQDWDVAKGEQRARKWSTRVGTKGLGPLFVLFYFAPLKMVAEVSSEVLVIFFYQPTRRHIPEQRNLIVPP
jgi:hypothetical protein